MSRKHETCTADTPTIAEMEANASALAMGLLVSSPSARSMAAQILISQHPEDLDKWLDRKILSGLDIVQRAILILEKAIQEREARPPKKADLRIMPTTKKERR